MNVCEDNMQISLIGFRTHIVVAIAWYLYCYISLFLCHHHYTHSIAMSSLCFPNVILLYSSCNQVFCTPAFPVQGVDSMTCRELRKWPLSRSDSPTKAFHRGEYLMARHTQYWLMSKHLHNMFICKVKVKLRQNCPPMSNKSHKKRKQEFNP